jgi:hypothetical protein
MMIGRAKRRLRYLLLLERQAIAGSASATEKLLRLVDRADRRDEAKRRELLYPQRPRPLHLKQR